MRRDVCNTFLAAARGIPGLLWLGVSCLGCTDAAHLDSDEAKQRVILEMCVDNERSFPGVPELSPEEAAAMQAAGGVVFVDVREREEFAVSHLPGAILVDAFEKSAAQHRDAKVIAYCTIGYRSGLYAAKLREKGFDAYNLRGSLLSWVHAGRPLVDEAGDTKRLHVYGRKWDLAPAGYDTTW